MPSVFLGTFTLALSILYLEIFAARVISFVSGPESMYTTIAVAMLGMSIAAALATRAEAASPPRPAPGKPGDAGTPVGWGRGRRPPAPRPWPPG